MNSSVIAHERGRRADSEPSELALELVRRLGRRPFSWGGTILATTSALRGAYIDALHEAEPGNMEPLMEFARS